MIVTGNDEKYGKNANTALPDNTLYGYWAADDNMVWDNILGKQRAYSLFGSANAAMENSASQLDTCVISVPSTIKIGVAISKFLLNLFDVLYFENAT